MSEFPLQIEIVPGCPAYEQVIHAVHRAIAAGLLVEGDGFPSVRALSKIAKINPNTAHKVVQVLVQEGTLEVLSGRGTRVAPQQKRSSIELQSMIGEALDHLVIEAKRIGFTEAQLKKTLSDTWKKLTK
ncbi:MAG: GntR family transcriptional regulator [Rubritalea sp.]|uniref:GntR family transcriptional regulator n=1 Tax=Rubritalea sp. TaxID=2109375 RepID=UPI0032421D89